MASEEFEERQRRNLAEIEELRSSFIHDDIKEFHEKHLGIKDRRDYGPVAFIPVEHCYRNEYNAIHCVLLFLDHYGDQSVPVGDSAHTTTLREHNLRLAEVVIESLRRKRLSSFYVFRTGFAALANNIGLGLGSTYCESFKGKPPVGVGQASLALLEQMPEFRCLHQMEDIQEIIKFFHLSVETSINSPKLHIERENDAWKLAKLIAAAEHQVRREEIFYATEKPEGFWSADEQTKARNAEEANEIAEQAAQERQKLKIKDNRENYLAEIIGLKNRVKQLVRTVQEIKIKNKIIVAQKKLIAALESGKEKAITASRKELENVETKLQNFMAAAPHETDESRD